MSSRRIQYYEKKKTSTGKLKLKHICMRTVCSYYRKTDRGGRVDDFGAQGVVKFRSLVKNGKLFDVSSAERQMI